MTNTTSKIDPVEEKAITATLMDYFEGWFDGDAVRMERALYPQLAKRGYRAGKPINEVSAKEMVDDTRAGEGKKDRPADLGIRVQVHDQYNDIATATVYSAVFIEYCHLIKTENGWKILNTLYTRATKK